MARAIIDFNSRLGIASEVLDPASLLWVGTDPLTVQSVAVRPGAPFPAPGAPVVSGPMAVASLRLADLEGQPVPSERLVDRSLVIRDLMLPLTDGDLDSSGRQQLAERFPDTPGELSASLRLMTPIELVAVPAGAIVTDPDGRTCVLDMAGESVFVAVVDSEPGRAYIDPTERDEKVPEAILANPHHVRSPARCS